MLQLVSVIFIIIISICYIAYRTYMAIHEAKSGCYGCKGCALKEQMIKNSKQNKHTSATVHAEKCSNFRKIDS